MYSQQPPPPQQGWQQQPQQPGQMPPNFPPQMSGPPPTAGQQQPPPPMMTNGNYDQMQSSMATMSLGKPNQVPLPPTQGMNNMPTQANGNGFPNIVNNNYPPSSMGNTNTSGMDSALHTSKSPSTVPQGLPTPSTTPLSGAQTPSMPPSQGRPEQNNPLSGQSQGQPGLQSQAQQFGAQTASRPPSAFQQQPTPQPPMAGLPGNLPQTQQQAGFPPHTQQNPNYPSQSQQGGFPPQSQQPGFPPHPPQAGLPPQQQQKPGIPKQSGFQSQQNQGLPPQRQPGLPPQQGFPPQAQQPGIPPQQQSGFPPQSQPGFPPKPQQPSGFPPQPQQQPGFPPQPQQQQPGFPPQPHNQQPGFPPQPQQQPGFPPQPQQQPGFPPQTQQQPGFPPQPQQQPGFPPQPQQQPGFPPQPQQQPGFSPQPQGIYNQPQPGYPPMQQRPGMPPQPGYPGQPGFNQQQGNYPQAPSVQRRLDPDHMPNPIQVMIENQKNSGGVFVTNQPGLLPPLITTKFVCQDQGNSSPRFVRSSMYTVPATSDIIKTTALPFNLILSPFAKIVEGEYEPPIVQFGELGPVRCNRCKAYMSPNMQFIDAGRRFQCPMCKVSSEVPDEYFQHLDHTGQRVDKYERPELVLGTYEFTATKEYCRNNTAPTAPAFIFVIDVSYNNVKSGLVHLLCQNIKEILKHFPVDQGQQKSKMKVGFITFNNTVHFYNIKSTLAQPQMMVVGDVHDMFMPLLDGFLCDPEESEAVIDALMEQIPQMFGDTRETETILYPAIQAGLEALKAADVTGKLLVFNSSLPIADAPGKLKNRDDRKLLGTDKEKTVLQPQIPDYNKLGQDCVQVGCSVDLFVFNNSYIDVATIGQVPRLTGGEVYKYTYFQADHDGERLIDDIIKNVSRPIAFDAVMRVRTSSGIRPTDFYGHFFMSNTTDVELASIDSTKSIAIEIKHDDKLPPEENVYIQVALLYTSCSGQRRLRILNLALKTTTVIADVFKTCDLDSIMLFFGKQAAFKLMELSPKVVKDNVIHRSAQILSCYRKHCTSPTSPGQLILPECLKLLPLYVSCFLKNDAISGGSDMTLDDRSYVIQFLLSMDLETSVNFFYPRLIPIHNIEPLEDENAPVAIPNPIRCTQEKMLEDGAYILENGNYLFIWLGLQLSPSFVQAVFGVQSTHYVNTEKFALTQNTPLANRLRQILDGIMGERTRHMRITCVKQNDKLESVLRHFLVEDRGADGTSSYVDFLCYMHKEIKDLLS